jgi:regulator of sirC expression with transglutaminase-like and TPR domain
VQIEDGQTFISTPDRRFLVYRVEAEEGLRLKIRGEGLSKNISRSVPTEDVVLLENAEAYFTRKGAMEPGEPGWFFFRGLVRRETQNYDGALSDLDAHIRLRPNESTAYVGRAFIHEFKGEPDKALEDLDEAIRLDPEQLTAHFRRGRLLLSKSDYDGAVRDEDEAIRRDPENAEAYGVRGWARVGLGKGDEAVADFSESIRLDPEDARSFLGRGHVLLYQGKHGPALADLSETLRLNPKDHWSLNARAAIWATSPDAEIRDGPRAVQSASMACDLAGWRDALYLRTLAAAHAEMSNFDAAVQWQERALALQGDEQERRHDLKRLGLYKDRKPYRMEP